MTAKLLLVVTAMALSGSPHCAVAADAAAKTAFIDNLISQMTLDEKVGQLRLISIGKDNPKPKLDADIEAGRIGAIFNSVTRPENRPRQEASQRSRLKIPLFFAYDVVHGHRTIFPIGLGLASSWDMDVVRRSARVAAMEASRDGLDMTFAPMVDISHDPRWGRTSEGFGEDPFLVSDIARAMVQGLQGDSLANPASVMATVKHFALYGAVEGGRDYNVVDMSPMRMYQEFLPPYRSAIEAGAGGVMIALNSINGVPASANPWLLRDLLRRQWGFRGVTVSDHGAIHELINHGVAADDQQAAALALKSGVDLSMADSSYLEHLAPLVTSGKLDIKVVDDAVREVLGVKYDLGLFEDPFRRIGKTAADDPADPASPSLLSRADARAVARQSMVLLENRNKTLPLRKGARVALVGPLADAHIDVMGSWSAAGQQKQTVTLLEGMRDADAGQGRLAYARGSNATDDDAMVEYLNFMNWDEPEVTNDKRRPQAMLDEAVRVARRSDVIVAAVGETRGMSHESSSRTSLAIPASQQRLLQALKATGKPLVVVLMNGRPLELGWIKDNADAVLETWYTGTEGGHAISDVLYGDENPSGKLPITFPRSVGHIPAYYNHLRVGRPFTPGKPGNYTSQYFEGGNGPLYVFGHGLSYTTFSVSDVTMSSATMAPGGSVTASVKVRNTGDRAGATVVQLYIDDPVASVARPVKELKGYRKLMLQPGEEKTVDFTVGDDQLRFVNADLKEVVEPGRFNVHIGLDSEDVKVGTFVLEGPAPR